VAVLVEQFLKCLGDGEPGEYLGCVVRRGLLPLAARQPEDERAPLVHDRLLLAGNFILDADKVLLIDAVGPLDRDNPRSLGRVAVLGHFVQVGLGEEAGVGHQALVDRAELVDAKLGVGDEAAVLAPGLLAQQQVAQHPLQCCVPQAGLVDQRGCLRQEQVSPQAVEDQPFLLAVRRLWRLVALVDEHEQPGH
jgi:hypothetical protein